MFSEVKNVNVESLKNGSKLLFFSAELLHLFLQECSWMDSWVVSECESCEMHASNEKQQGKKEVTRRASPQPAIHSLHSSYPRSTIICSIRFIRVQKQNASLRCRVLYIVAVLGFVYSLYSFFLPPLFMYSVALKQSDIKPYTAARRFRAPQTFLSSDT